MTRPHRRPHRRPRPGKPPGRFIALTRWQWQPLLALSGHVAQLVASLTPVVLIQRRSSPSAPPELLVNRRFDWTYLTGWTCSSCCFGWFHWIAWSCATPGWWSRTGSQSPAGSHRLGDWSLYLGSSPEIHRDSPLSQCALTLNYVTGWPHRTRHKQILVLCYICHSTCRHTSTNITFNT